MFTVNGQYQVVFHHDRTGTTCVIFPDAPKGERYPEPVAIGQSVVKHNEPFSTVIGRKQSLKSALKRGEFDRLGRSLFWNVYIKTSKVVP